VDIDGILNEVIRVDQVREARLHCGIPGFCVYVCLSTDSSAGMKKHTTLMNGLL
jgi:hypothetical protein